jgi:uncharacterized membrane protein YuzA (DUF378 family)
MNRLALLMVIVGAINWLMVGLFQMDVVASIFGGQYSLLSRIIYTVVGLSGVWSIAFLFRERSLV